MIEREYEYRLKAGRVETRAILYGAGALFMAYMAITNDRALELFVIPLSKDAATRSYWIFAGLAAIMCVVDAINVSRRSGLRQRIAFDKDSLLVPKSNWSEEEQRIPYDSIVDLKPFNEPDSLVVIRHKGGEFTLRMDMLADERVYAEVVQNLASRVQSARGEAVAGAKPQAKPSGLDELPGATASQSAS